MFSHFVYLDIPCTTARFAGSVYFMLRRERHKPLREWAAAATQRLNTLVGHFSLMAKLKQSVGFYQVAAGEPSHLEDATVPRMACHKLTERFY